MERLYRSLCVTVALVGLPSLSMAQNAFPGSGNVGIGTANPQAQLHMMRPSGMAEQRIESPTDSALSYYQNGALVGRLWYPGGNDAGSRYFGFQNVLGEYLRFDAGNNKPIYFLTTGVPRLLIASDGRVAIGTTTLTPANLTVVGDASISGNVAVTGISRRSIRTSPNGLRLASSSRRGPWSCLISLPRTRSCPQPTPMTRPSPASFLCSLV